MIYQWVTSDKTKRKWGIKIKVKNRRDWSEHMTLMYRLLRTRHGWWNRWVLIFFSSVENPSPQSTTRKAGRGMSDHLSRYPYDSFISCGKRYSIMSPLFPSAALLCRMKCSIDSKLSSVKCMLWLSWDFQVNFDVSIFLCQHA